MKNLKLKKTEMQHLPTFDQFINESITLDTDKEIKKLWEPIQAKIKDRVKTEKDSKNQFIYVDMEPLMDIFDYALDVEIEKYPGLTVGGGALGFDYKTGRGGAESEYKKYVYDAKRNKMTVSIGWNASWQYDPKTIPYPSNIYVQAYGNINITDKEQSDIRLNIAKKIIKYYDRIFRYIPL
jgi:hypothetical protein